VLSGIRGGAESCLREEQNFPPLLPPLKSLHLLLVVVLLLSAAV